MLNERKNLHIQNLINKYQQSQNKHEKSRIILEIIKFYEPYCINQLKKIFNSYPFICLVFEDFEWIKYLSFIKAYESYAINPKIDFSKYYLTIFKCRSIDYARKMTKKGSIALNAANNNAIFENKISFDPYKKFYQHAEIQNIFFNNKNIYSEYEFKVVELKLKGYKKEEISLIIQHPKHKVEKYYLSALNKAKKLIKNEL